MPKSTLKYPLHFALELGEELPEVEITYHTYGKLNNTKTNVIWVFHALTANADAADWWSGLIGAGKLFDPTKHFIVCANILGSCYGSTGPLSVNSQTGKPYYNTFPNITIRDMVKAHKLLKKHLGVKKIQVGIGGSMGGYQLLEWALMEQNLFENIVPIATAAKESAWGIGIHTAQRMAMENDSTWGKEKENAAQEGMKIARAIGLLTYRNYETFVKTQTDEKPVTKNHKAASYLKYQGDKLAERFNAYSYHIISQAQDTHNIARNRSTLEKTLGWIKANTLVIGIKSDILCPITEQKFLVNYIPNSELAIIDSEFGHDGMLVESEAISKAIKENLSF